MSHLFFRLSLSVTVLVIAIIASVPFLPLPLHAASTSVGLSPANDEVWLVRGQEYRKTIQVFRSGSTRKESAKIETQQVPANELQLTVPQQIFFLQGQDSVSMDVAVDTSRAAVGDHVFQVTVHLPREGASTNASDLDFVISFQAKLHLVQSVNDLPVYLDAAKEDVKSLFALKNARVERRFYRPDEPVTLTWDVENLSSSSTINNFVYEVILDEGGKQRRITKGAMSENLRPQATLTGTETFDAPKKNGRYQVLLKMGNRTKTLSFRVSLLSERWFYLLYASALTGGLFLLYAVYTLAYQRRMAPKINDR